MKTAVVFDFLTTKGGMERTVATLAREFKADIWTTEYIPERTYPQIRKFKVFSHPLRFFHHLGLMQTEALLKFRRMDLSGYDLIISSGDWGKHVGIKSGNHPQIHYDNTPVRAFYDLHEVIKKRFPFFHRQAFKAWVWLMKGLDQQAVQKIDKLVCNSKNVQKRVKKYYKMDAEIVGVPINVKKFKRRKPEDFFISVQRIEPEKRIDLQIEAFRRLPNEKLVIVGAATKQSMPYLERLKRWTPKNVTFAGSVSDEELVDLYSRCKAAIQTSIDEDFGEVPVEAMASGKPCLAVNEGGFKESIVHSKTGLLIKPPYTENLVKAIKNLNKYNFDSRACMGRAKLFSEEVFVERFKRAVAGLLREHSQD
jgi:glycosyltransferase involved in cell wall biosynthesis